MKAPEELRRSVTLILACSHSQRMLLPTETKTLHRSGSDHENESPCAKHKAVEMLVIIYTCKACTRMVRSGRKRFEAFLRVLRHRAAIL